MFRRPRIERSARTARIRRSIVPRLSDVVDECPDERTREIFRRVGIVLFQNPTIILTRNVRGMTGWR
jgi:hypothetical protein